MFVRCVRRHVQWSVAEKWFLLSGLLLLYDMPLPAAPFNALHFLTRQPAWVLHRVTVYDINLPFNALDFLTRRRTQLIHRALHCVTVYDIHLSFNALDFLTRRPTQLLHRVLHSFNALDF